MRPPTARELAPLAGHYPCLKLGPAWWFHDSPEGMMRYRRQTTESAGFYNTAGFNDDTRAFFSIPARHDLARRIDCAYLSELVIQGRLAHGGSRPGRSRSGLQPAQKSLQAVNRLNAAALARLPAAIARPAFDPARLKSGIVHLGIGAFHRAHQAVFTEDAIEAAGGDWGIIGASLKQPGVPDTLAAQDSLYTVEILGQRGKLSGDGRDRWRAVRAA